MHEDRICLLDAALADVLMAARGECCRVKRERSGYLVEGDWADGGASAVILAEQLSDRELYLERLEAIVAGGRVAVTLSVLRSRVVRFPMAR